jgi:hypothetical protein
MIASRILLRTQISRSDHVIAYVFGRSHDPIITQWLSRPLSETLTGLLRRILALDGGHQLLQAWGEYIYILERASKERKSNSCLNAPPPRSFFCQPLRP